VIWILGDFVGLPFLAVGLIQMMREDKAEAAIIDAELDARDAARKAAQAGAQADARDRTDMSDQTDVSDQTSADDRPWWETDPRITERFKNA
jgi:hypothetical protein